MKEELLKNINKDLDDLKHAKFPESLGGNVTLYTINEIIDVKRFLESECEGIFAFINDDLKKYFEYYGVSVIEMFDGNYQVFLS